MSHVPFPAFPSTHYHRRNFRVDYRGGYLALAERMAVKRRPVAAPVTAAPSPPPVPAPVPSKKPRAGKKKPVQPDGIYKYKLGEPIKAGDVRAGMTVFASGALCRVKNVFKPTRLKGAVILEFTAHPYREDFQEDCRSGDTRFRSIIDVQHETV